MDEKETGKETLIPSFPDKEDEEQFERLVKNKLTMITSSAASPSRKFILVTTDKGFVLITTATANFTRYEGKSSPFYRNEATPYGARLGSMLESRNEVALVPNFSSKQYRPTAIYIYDYSIRIILSTFDFILPIQQFSLTDCFLVSSNNKRLVLYNYLKGALPNDEKGYIQAYKAHKNPNILRYLPLDCHLYHPEKPQVCQCGRYVLARTASYLKIFYIRVSVIQNATAKSLYFFDETVDKPRIFGGLEKSALDFDFNLSEEGKYLVVAEDFGRRIMVFNLQDNCLHTVLHLSRNPKPILNLGIVTLPDATEWVIASREKENDEATMHLFRLTRTPPTQHVESNFKRYFRLYKQFSVSDRVFAEEDKFLGPEYYLVREKFYCLALEGEYCQVIDLKREGLHEKGNVQDYRRLEQTDLSVE